MKKLMFLIGILLVAVSAFGQSWLPIHEMYPPYTKLIDGIYFFNGGVDGGIYRYYDKAGNVFAISELNVDTCHNKNTTPTYSTKTFDKSTGIVKYSREVYLLRKTTNGWVKACSKPIQEDYKLYKGNWLKSFCYNSMGKDVGENQPDSANGCRVVAIDDNHFAILLVNAYKENASSLITYLKVLLFEKAGDGIYNFTAYNSTYKGGSNVVFTYCELTNELKAIGLKKEMSSFKLKTIEFVKE